MINIMAVGRKFKFKSFSLSSAIQMSIIEYRLGKWLIDGAFIGDVFKED